MLLSLVLASFLGASPLAAQEIHFLAFRPQTMKVWERAIARFERENPGSRVVLELAPHSSTDFHDLVAQKLNNRDPRLDVFFMDVVWPAEFAGAGWALPLDRFFPATARADFLAPAIAANAYRGRIYGVPVFVDAGMLYYRKDLLEKHGLKPPRTWPELARQAKLVVERERDPGLVGYSGQFKQYEGLVCNMMEFILSNGAALWDEKRLRGLLHLPAAKEAVRFVRDRILGEIAHRGSLAYQEPESLALFVQGKAVFHRNWPYAWEVANDPRQSAIAGRVGAGPLPAFPGGESVSTLGGWQLAISRFSRHPELSWKLVEILTGPEIQREIAIDLGRPPARKSLYHDPQVRKRSPHLEWQLEILLRAVPRPTTPAYAPLSNIMQRYFSSAISVSSSDIDQLAALATRDMDRVLELLREREAR